MAHPQHLSTEYIARKRTQLLKLKEELRLRSDAAEAEEQQVSGETSLRAREFEDDAQKLDMLEKEGNLVRRAVDRLGQVERALKKIEDGTYGISDISGKHIPSDRLDAVPEASTTLSEEEAGERAR